jgi:hypothetical protein
VRQASASLFVDGLHIGARPRTLLGVVENCDVPSVDCRLVTGARASNNAGYAFPWTGKLGDVTVYAGTFLTFDPSVAVPLPAVGALPVDAVSTFPYFDLMATSRHVYHGSVNVVAGLFSLNGLNTSVELASHDFVPGSDFSLAFSLRVTPNAAGYVYAKGDPSGRRPYVAVEYNPTSATRGQSTVFKKINCMFVLFVHFVRLGILVVIHHGATVAPVPPTVFGDGGLLVIVGFLYRSCSRHLVLFSKIHMKVCGSTKGPWRSGCLMWPGWTMIFPTTCL